MPYPLQKLLRLTDEDIQECYRKIKSDIQNLFFVELALLKVKEEAEKDEAEASIDRQVKDILNPDGVEKDDEHGPSISM
jgi:hypothetical protein